MLQRYKNPQKFSAKPVVIPHNLKLPDPQHKKHSTV